jgi:hypothetical protein
MRTYCSEELRSGHPVQYLNNLSLGQNLSSTSGEPEFVAQKFQPRIKLKTFLVKRQACYIHIATPHPWFRRN